MRKAFIRALGALRKPALREETVAVDEIVGRMVRGEMRDANTDLAPFTLVLCLVEGGVSAAILTFGGIQRPHTVAPVTAFVLRRTPSLTEGKVLRPSSIQADRY